MTSELRRVHSSFKEDNPLLLLSLGLLSSFAKVDRILDEHADGDGSESLDSTSEEAAAFVLGLIAFRRRFEKQLNAAKREKRKVTPVAANDEQEDDETEGSLWR